MRKKGHITVFLSLTLLCIFSLMCGLIESARTAGTRFYLKLAADSAMDSVFSNYHRGAFDQYRIFLLDQDEEELKTSWMKFLKPYMDASGWYSMEAKDGRISRQILITDDNGEHLNQEIVDYMKYGVFSDATKDGREETMLKQLEEAKTVQNISESYNSHTKEAVRLEQALDDISNSLLKQEEYRQKANQYLGNYNGFMFRRNAKALKKEINHFPALVKNYKKKADKLKRALEKTVEDQKRSSNKLSKNVWEAMEGEILCYDTYVQKDGERRVEILTRSEQVKSQTPIIQTAIDRAGEVEDILSRYADRSDEDEDDDAPDLSELWGSVEEIWSQVSIPRLSYRKSVKDPEKQNVLEKIEKLGKEGLLLLVLPEGKSISKGVLIGDSLPSALYTGERGASQNLLDRVLFQEYCGRFLTNFLSDEDKDVKYEMEYMIAGRKSDQDNLGQTLAEILAIREGLNLVHILSDSQKRQEAISLAATITGVTGLAPLTGVVAFFIMSIWALGEAVLDIRRLLEGKKVAFIKNKDNWKLSLTGLLELGTNGLIKNEDEDDKGFGYLEYLKFLLLIGSAHLKYYRLMDVMQMNLIREDKKFRMEHCIYQAEIEADVVSRHIFLGGSHNSYQLTVRTEKAY
ncbi:DUF5702 domain-containing protein [Clostridium sp. E02]|uniref:DUF5702 domain-containing protein n=1 Tax=Clostridium sp. E02 TaxID=2487134 RepID=UPI000F524513|nr:DUF5702 domain-containing protein [Clostridium sp. E02]